MLKLGEWFIIKFWLYVGLIFWVSSYFGVKIMYEGVLNYFEENLVWSKIIF